MAGTNSLNEGSYVLGRSMFASIRLDAQHLLWRLHTGYTIHPDIAIKQDMRVAELGTGTGLWVLDLASQLPESAQLDGYDISAGQFPAKVFWPANVTFNMLDAFGDVPSHLAGTYDVVHLRFWCCVVKGNDPGPLIRHAAKLLKPGGYIQWEDGNLARTVMRGETAKRFGDIAFRAMATANLKYNWIGDVQQHITHATDGQIQVVECKYEQFQQNFIPLCMNSYLMGHEEFGQGLDALRGLDSSLPSKAEFLQLLNNLWSETQSSNAAYYWEPFKVLARKQDRQ